MPDAWKLLLICTDRGQHSTAALGSVRRLASGLTFYDPTENARRTSSAASQSSTRGRSDGGQTYWPHCDRCGRDKPIRLENVVKLVKAGLSEVDISILP